MIVAKFGGSILDGAEGVRRAVREIRALPRPLLIVVSAFRTVTNRLEEIGEQALSDLTASQTSIDRLFDDHSTIAADVLDDSAFREFSSTLEPWRDRLHQLAEGISITGELSPRTLDLVVHFGEGLSSALISGALDAPCIPAMDIIITDDSHRYAHVDIDRTRDRVESDLRSVFELGTDLAVTEGYIARAHNGEITTMGRESSDFSATLLGELLGADEVRVYTGVAGIMSADPAIVPTARTVERMSYGLAKEIAILGAKIIYSRTVRPVERAGIPLVFRNLAGDHTLISKKGDDKTSLLTLLDEAHLLTLATSSSETSTDELLALLREVVQVIYTWRAGRSIWIVVDSDPSGVLDDILEFDQVVNATVERRPLLTMSREGGVRPSDAARFLEGLGSNEIVAYWSDPDRYSVCALLPAARSSEMLVRLHDELFPTERAGSD